MTTRRSQFLTAAVGALLMVVLIAPAAAVPICDVTGHCYDTNTNLGLPNNTWSGAAAAAGTVSLGGRPGRLVTITSDAESRFIGANFDAFISSLAPWIGLSQSQTGVEPGTPSQGVAGGWQWVTGEPFYSGATNTTADVIFQNWLPGEPNDSAGAEDAVTLGHLSGAGNIAFWNDVNAETVRTFIVEFEPAGLGGAAPSINGVSVFTDNRPADDPFGIPGYRIALTISVSDPLGVPGNIASVTARNLTTGETHLPPFAAGEANVLQGPYLLFIPFSAARLGVWRFTVTNRQNEVAVLDSHNLDKPVQLSFPQGIRLENFPGTAAEPPRVRFDQVAEADSYALEIYDTNLVGLFLAPTLSTPVFQIPAGLMTAGREFVLRARAFQLDPTEPVVPRVSGVENRSVNAVRFFVSDTRGVASTTNRSGSFAEPVNTATGGYLFQRTDLAVPGRGLSLIFTRTYNSPDFYAGPLGHGWTHSYNLILTENAGGLVAIKWGDGHEEAFVPVGGGAYDSLAPGGFNTLVKNANADFALTTKNQTRYEFSSSGRLRRIQDRNGNALALGYDASGNLVTITDAVGRIATLTYDSRNHLVRLNGPMDRTTEYAYDANDDLRSVTDPAGGVASFAYDANHRMTEIRDERGVRILTNVYDPGGRVISQTDGRGSTTTFAYGVPTPSDTRITEPRGNTTIHTHDAQFRLTEMTSPDGKTVRFTYDGDNNRTSITDQNGKATLLAYDGRGNVTSVTDPVGHVIGFTYDGQNNLTSARNARGFTTVFGYDARGNLLEIKDALGNTTSFAYDTAGQLIRKTDARGNATQYAYDGQGNLMRITDALGGVTTLAYDGIGRLLRLTDPNGQTANVGYDANSRLTQIVDPLGTTTRFTFDTVGNLTEIVDAKGSRTRYAYDELNNLATVTDALGNATRYAYDVNNNRTAFTNANGRATAYVFDALNRLARISDPLGQATAYSYDAVGNVRILTNANGTTNAFVYDTNNRLTRINYGDGQVVTYSYDANGNRATMADSRGSTTYTYDALDRLVEVAHPEGKVGYGYDEVGNRTRSTYPDGKVVTDRYDGLNRLADVTDWNGRTTRYSYDAASNLLQVAYPNGRTISYSYDGANRLTEVAHRLGSQLMAQFIYTLDPLGNRREIVKRLAGSPLRASRNATERFIYDALSQLLAAEEHLAGRPFRRTEYAYDAVGNRTSLKGFRFANSRWMLRTTVPHDYDAADRLLRAGDTTFTYDAAGNRLTEVGPNSRNLVYTYDAAHRLVQIDRGAHQIAYDYDGDGNKVERATNQNGPLETIRFLNDVATALPVVLREDAPQRDITYLYGLGLTAEEIQQAGRSPDAFFYHTDGLGSTVALTDARGTPRTAYEYDPWGNLEVGVGGVPNRFLFTGEERDPDTGLYYLRARWYDPSVGRFLSRDPFAGFARQPASLNRFVYVRNNPLRLVDPLGFTPLDAKTAGSTPVMIVGKTAPPILTFENAESALRFFTSPSNVPKIAQALAPLSPFVGILNPLAGIALVPGYIVFSTGAQIGFFIADTAFDTNQPTNLRPLMRDLSKFISCPATSQPPASELPLTTPQLCGQ